MREQSFKFPMDDTTDNPALILSHFFKAWNGYSVREQANMTQSSRQDDIMIEELPQRLAERSMVISTIAVMKKLFWLMRPGQFSSVLR
jgi:hypothetical protein